MTTKVRETKDVRDPSLRAIIEYLLFARDPEDLMTALWAGPRSAGASFQLEGDVATARVLLWGEMYELAIKLRNDADDGPHPIAISLAPESLIHGDAAGQFATNKRGEIGERLLSALGDPDTHSSFDESVWVTWFVNDIDVTYRYGPSVVCGAVIDLNVRSALAEE